MGVWGWVCVGVRRCLLLGGAGAGTGAGACLLVVAAAAAAASSSSSFQVAVTVPAFFIHQRECVRVWCVCVRCDVCCVCVWVCGGGVGCG